jgi:hypothetical protein
MEELLRKEEEILTKTLNGNPRKRNKHENFLRYRLSSLANSFELLMETYEKYVGIKPFPAVPGKVLYECDNNQFHEILNLSSFLILIVFGRYLQTFIRVQNPSEESAKRGGAKNIQQKTSGLGWGTGGENELFSTARCSAIQRRIVGNAKTKRSEKEEQSSLAQRIGVIEGGCKQLIDSNSASVNNATCLLKFMLLFFQNEKLTGRINDLEKEDKKSKDRIDELEKKYNKLIERN